MKEEQDEVYRKEEKKKPVNEELKERYKREEVAEKVKRRRSSWSSDPGKSLLFQRRQLSLQERREL